MKKIALMTGGNSGEYEVSLKTAKNIMEMLDKSLFIPYLIHLKGNSWSYTHTDGRVIEIDKNDFTISLDGEKIAFDAVFIAIHGNPGENGRLQAYFDMIDLPYTGCDMLSSALTFNKYYCNLTVAALDVPVSRSLHFFKGDVISSQQVADVCQFPCFVKPCNSGSSVGVTKVHNEQELNQAVEEAFRYDSQLMIEKFIPGREVTCGVAKIDGKIRALAVTEIKSKKEYYDFEAKYTPGFLELVTPAEISTEMRDTIFKYSERIFKELGCAGVVRIDYIITPQGIPYFLEINTIPGQTAMSIVPRQIKYLGLDLTQIYTGLIEEALEK